VKGENGPVQFDSIFPLQAIGTHGTEVAPGSDIVEKDLYDGRFFHDYSSFFVHVRYDKVFGTLSQIQTFMPNLSCSVKSERIFVLHPFVERFGSLQIE
jgi:hypothetical protein